MKIVEHYRHSDRDKPNPHLNQIGVTKARKAGETKKFDYVLTSDEPRAIETAVAMGFAVNKTDSRLSTIAGVTGQDFPYLAGFKRINNFIKTDSNANRTILPYIENLRLIISHSLKKILEEQTMLIVSHGGIVELSAIAILRDYNFNSLNFNLKTCEGVKLVFENGQCINLEIIEN